jgi:hypothetical protein
VSFGDTCWLHLHGDRIVLVDAVVIWVREWLGDIDRLPVRANPFLCFWQGTFDITYLYKWPCFLLWITFCSNWPCPLQATYVTNLLSFLVHFPIYEDSSFMEAVCLWNVCLSATVFNVKTQFVIWETWKFEAASSDYFDACLLTTCCHLGRLESSKQRKTYKKLKAMLTECKQREFLKEITDLIGQGAEENGSWQVKLDGVNRSYTCLNAWWWQKWCLGLQVSCLGRIVIQPHVNVFNVKQ